MRSVLKVKRTPKKHKFITHFDCRHLDILSINCFQPQAHHQNNLIIIIKKKMLKHFHHQPQRASRRHIWFVLNLFYFISVIFTFFSVVLCFVAFHTMPFNYIKNFLLFSLKWHTIIVWDLFTYLWQHNKD